MDNSNQSQTLHRALLALEKMEARLKAVEASQREPIAILGVGCRFPGGAFDAESFWQLLRDGVDTVTEVPVDRWDIDRYFDPDPDVPGKMYTRKGAFLEDIDRFDPQFFGIMPKEAHAMDPQQRLLIETTWEALENAGIAPDSLTGSRTGVFVGILGTDYASLQTSNGGINEVGPYYGSGVAHSIASGRISYLLGLQGPSMSIDTACSSSLVAIHQACLSLRSKEINLAVAGGVNLILTPDATIALSKNRMMAADGHCKTFDASANGYVRGEGCGIIVMKRLSDALADGNSILAVIRGTAINQDGASSGLTAPNGPQQEAVIREALSNGGIDPLDVTYVETHGTGTSLGDPIEVQALAASLCKSRPANQPLLIGSVKTNVGHLETAAGMAGLVKIIMAIKHKAIPPHLHLKRPNPFIPWAQLPISVPTKLTPWVSPKAPLVAGLSSFGFSGTNAHLIITAPPERASKSVHGTSERPGHILTLSAKSESALTALSERMAVFLSRNPTIDLANVAHTLNTGRATFAHRLALRADTVEEAAARFRAFAAGTDPAGLVSGHVLPNKRFRVAFLFTGQGSQYLGMGRQLYETQPLFRTALDQCASLIQAYLPHPLLEMIFADEGSEHASLLDQTAYTQVALFSIEYSLATLWRSWGIEPFAVMGHSVGEYVAACLAGVFQLEDAVRLVAERGRLMQSLPPGGRMSAVQAEEARICETIRPFRDKVSIAAINGPTNIVISGDGKAIESICASLEADRIKTRSLNVSHAFHSPLVEPILSEFENVASSIQYNQPQLRLISNLTGTLAMGETVTKASYWRDHIRQPVQFARGVKSLLELNVDVLLEVGPTPTLLGMTSHIAGADEKLSIPTLRRDREEWSQILESLGNLFTQGIRVNWEGFDQPYKRQDVELPTYPFRRQRYWIVPKPLHNSGRTAEYVHPLLGRTLTSPLKFIQFESYLDRESFSFIRDHQLRGTSILPMTAYLEMALAAGKSAFGAVEIELCDVVIHQPMVLEGQNARITHVVVDPQSETEASFEIHSRYETDTAQDWQLHASGRIEQREQTAVHIVGLQAIKERSTKELTSDDHYREVEQRGFPFGPAMKGVHHIWRRDGEALVEVLAPAETADRFESFHTHPALLDACLQGIWTTFDLNHKKSYMPMSLERLAVLGSLPKKIFSHIRLREKPGDNLETVIGDVDVMDEHGSIIAQISGLYFRLISGQLLPVRREWEDWFYEVDWQLQTDEDRGPVHDPPLVSVEDVAREIDFHVLPLSVEYQIDQYKEMLPQLEKLSSGYVAAALTKMGFKFQAGQRIAADELISILGIKERYRRLTFRLLEILTDAEYLEKNGNEWVVHRIPGSEINEHTLKVDQERLLSQYPASSGQLTLTGLCDESLAGVLRGGVDPLSLLFPGGSLEITEQLYRETPPSRILNTLISDGIQKVVETLPKDRSLRILEVGAGTGGTTSYVLPVLPAERTEYYFTDISALFLDRARERFAGNEYVRYEILNIENDPAAQGFAEGSFDLVVAANVLHATIDLSETLAHIRQLLKPNGLFMLMENIRLESWVDLTFGLTEGWWRFRDTQLRDYPLIPRQIWSRVLISSGFKSITTLPSDESQFSQTLILAEAAAAPAGYWLIFADGSGVGQQLANQLVDLNQACALVTAGEGFKNNEQHYTIDPSSPDDFKRLLSVRGGDTQGPLRGVVYLWSLDQTESAEQAIGVGGAFRLVQALASSGMETPHLWLVTRDVQPVPGLQRHAIEESPIWGFGRSIQLEHPELRCTCIDLDGGSLIDQQAQSLLSELWKADAEDQVAFRDGQKYHPRLHRIALEETSPGSQQFNGQTMLQLRASRNGVLEELAWQPVSPPTPGPDEVAIEVRAAGLNFRDLMNALAMRSDDKVLGGECSGVVTGVGMGVTQFKIGDAVMGMARGSFGTIATANVNFVVSKPEQLSFAEAGALPIAYFTAYYCLHYLAQLKKGQKVLIHAAAGGVGMASVQIALRAGAEVFATAGSPAKRNFLLSMGVAHVLNSRTLDFADEINMLTNRSGVDVVLNSLAGDFIAQSVAVLSPKGIFIEIGKRDIWTPEQFSKAKPSGSYHIVDLATMQESEEAGRSALFTEVMELLRCGELKPLPIKSFPRSQVSGAFRYMAQALHTGKIVVSSHAYHLRPDATYLITGGLTGLGLLTARHLVEHNVHHLVLVGRSAPSSIVETTLRTFEAQGVQVQVMQADVSNVGDVCRIVDYVKQNMPALRGIIHAAGVLDDASILRQDWNRFERVMAPKVDGTWNLHNLTMNEPLDFFIMYSSTSSLMGSPGQSNYAAANTFLDTLAHERRSRGLPALTINWGIWSEIGSAAERKTDERMLYRGVGSIRPEQGLEMMDLLFAQERSQIAVLPIEWKTFLPEHKKPAPLFSLLAEEKRWVRSKTGKGSAPASVSISSNSEPFDLRQQLDSIPPNQQHQFLKEHIHTQVVKAIGLESGQRIDPRQPLNELGLDSLMAVELRNMLRKSMQLKQNLPATLAFDYPTINALTDYFTQDVFKMASRSADTDSADQGDLIKDIENLSDEEVARMLSDLE
jgi:acyl transferase domain-containing protein/NADPH:quinone reductase-like Zn-dependent oxidoreductase/short-subunit dehydrogenase/SAM-dependent methyltransferase